MKKVLSIDGGGMHGIIAASVLEHLEAMTGRSIAAQFNLVVGTSIGGLLAVALTQEVPLYTARRVREILEAHGHEIFIRRWLPIRWLFGPKYDARHLEAFLQRYLSGGPLSRSLVPVVLTAYNIERRQPVFMQSWVKEWRAYPCWKAARATSAAPTYFSPFERMVDGGIYVNNPAAVAEAEARRLWPDQELFILSLGNGEHTRPIKQEDAKDDGLAEWAPHIISCMMDGQSKATDLTLRERPGLTYFRLQTCLDNAYDEFDRADEKQIKLLRQDADEMIEEHQSDLQQIIQILRT